MGRIRTVKPEFFLNEELYDLEQETGLPIRLAYAGLWCQCDREGRFKWQPRKLKVTVLPYDDIDFSRVLHALTTRGFVEKYESNSAFFGCIPGFLQHQVINNKERASVLPEPNKNNSLTREPRVDDALSTRDVRKGREGNKKAPDKSDANYVFEGETIKLNQKDYADCQAKYPNLDLDYHLGQLDSELRETKKWFQPMHSKLNYRNKTPTHQSKAGESYL